MKQRIGIARALAMKPKVLLLDEPFGALDALTRAHLQDQVMQIHASLGTTVMMITHDVDEAVLLSDRIVMLTNGPNARIGEILEVDLPRPRDRLALAADPRFVAARASVLEFLHAPPHRPGPRRRMTSGSWSSAPARPARAAPCGWRSGCPARQVTLAGAEPALPYDRVALSRCWPARWSRRR